MHGCCTVHTPTHSLGASCPLGCLSLVRRLWHITVHQHAGLCSVWLSDLSRVSRFHSLMCLRVFSWFAHNVLGSLYPSSLVFFLCVFWDSSATSFMPPCCSYKKMKDRQDAVRLLRFSGCFPSITWRDFTGACWKKTFFSKNKAEWGRRRIHDGNVIIKSEIKNQIKAEWDIYFT